MASLSGFDTRVVEALARAEIDQDSAAQVLLLAAEYLRAGATMPRELAEHIAGAFVSAASKTPKLRGKQLALDLYLTAANRRKKGDWYTIGVEMDLLLAAGLKENQAAAELAAQTTAGDHLSESTILRRWKRYQCAVQANKEATRED